MSQKSHDPHVMSQKSHDPHVTSHLEGEEGVGVFHGETSQSVGEEHKLISLCLFVPAKERETENKTMQTHFAS